MTLWLNATEAPLVHRKSTPHPDRLVVLQRVGEAFIPDGAAAAHRLRGGAFTAFEEEQSWGGVLAGRPIAPAWPGALGPAGTSVSAVR